MASQSGCDADDFWGQGLIELRQPGLLAYFHDNTGPRVELVPTQENFRDARACG